MNKKVLSFLCIAVPLLSVVAGCRPAEEKLTLATAANVQFAMQALTKAFSDETGIPCDIVLGSSGKLTAQIKAGAPYDMFISANMKYPDELQRAGLTVGSPEIYAYGKLVLWTCALDTVPSIDMLQAENIRHIAIANPETAPYGSASLDLLKWYGLYDELKDKLVYGESIAQVNQYIISETATLGFTAKSVILSPEMKGKGTWKEMEDAAYSPIAQGAVVLKREGHDTSSAEKFFRFLFSDEAARILEEYGYAVNTEK